MLLRIDNLDVEFPTRRGTVKAARDVSLTVSPGEVDTPIMANRALPPDAEARARMMLPEDISAAVMMAVSLPRRAMVSEIAITATDPRDMTADIAAAKEKRA